MNGIRVLVIGAISSVACAAAFSGGCVTETVRHRPVKLPRGAGAGAPVATPATDAHVLTTRVRVEVTPLGSIPYDGQVLPLVSPDGSYVAAQQGRAPTWPTLTAGFGAAAPIMTHVAIYDVSGPQPREIEPDTPLPAGLLLGRDVSATGFLVESPRPDGSRWIGQVDWRTGVLTWLVQDGFVNAQASWDGAGELVYARRAIDKDRFAIVRDNEVIARNDASLEYPTPTGDGDLLFAIERSENGVFCVALRAGSVAARHRISTSHDPITAYQAAAPAVYVESADGGAQWVLFVPQWRRMGVFDAQTGVLTALPDGSISAASYSGAGGFFCTTPAGLVFVPHSAIGAPGNDIDVARVLAEPFVAVATSNLDRPFILLGPDPAGGDRLRIVALRPAVE